MSPTYHDLVYGHPKTIHTDTLEGEGWGPKSLVQNQTVKVYGTDKMDWRGESFLTAGKKECARVDNGKAANMGETVQIRL